VCAEGGRVAVAAAVARRSPPPRPPQTRKTTNPTGCKHAEVGDDDNAEPVCSDCKGPNFVYNDETELW
jgi:hypothetical protein